MGVLGCARCGGAHPELEFTALTNPIPSDLPGGPTFTHWAPCPTNGEPVLQATVLEGTGRAIANVWNAGEAIDFDDVTTLIAADIALLQLVVFRMKMLQQRRDQLEAASVDGRQFATAIMQAEGGLLWLEAACRS